MSTKRRPPCSASMHTSMVRPVVLLTPALRRQTLRRARQAVSLGRASGHSILSWPSAVSTSFVPRSRPSTAMLICHGSVLLTYLSHSPAKEHLWPHLRSLEGGPISCKVDYLGQGLLDHPRSQRQNDGSLGQIPVHRLPVHRNNLSRRVPILSGMGTWEPRWYDEPQPHPRTFPVFLQRRHHDHHLLSS